MAISKTTKFLRCLFYFRDHYTRTRARVRRRTIESDSTRKVTPYERQHNRMIGVIDDSTGEIPLAVVFCIDAEPRISERDQIKVEEFVDQRFAFPHPPSGRAKRRPALNYSCWLDISLGSSVVIVELPLNSPDSERSCCLASRQSESASPGSTNLRRCLEMK